MRNQSEQRDIQIGKAIRKLSEFGLNPSEWRILNCTKLHSRRWSVEIVNSMNPEVRLQGSLLRPKKDPLWESLQLHPQFD